MYKITVNSKFSFEVNGKRDSLTINGNSFSADLSLISENTFHIIHEHKSYTTELVDLNKDEKTCTVKVNGRRYTLELKDQFDELLHQLGMDRLTTSRIAELKAPMPGLVLQALVQEGDQVKKGDNLLVLEAMKMENILKAPADLTVKTVKISAGDKVEKNQVMITFA